MAVIKLAAFSGETPRIIPRLIAPNAAQTAIDARLDDGGLSPHNLPATVEILEGGPYDTIYRHGEEWLAFPGLVHFARGPVDGERLYFTGAGAPKMRVGQTVYPLAVPRPTIAPAAALTGSGDGDVQTRAYVYTFVTAYGEESEPSAASNEVAWQPGQSVTLSGIQDAPDEPDRAVTRQRIYRSQSGSAGADFYFIAERDASDGNFVDTVPVDAFAEPLPSRHWHAPPDTLAGLTTLPNGMMAAFSGRRLYFCEPYRPHAWPEIYVLTTDTPIVALAAMGTTVWVLTESFPYRVVGTSPDAMAMAKAPAALPCINPRAVVDLGHAVAWPSHEGLAVARADGTVALATANIFSPRAWQRLNPASIRGGQISGRWVGSYSAADEQGMPEAGSLVVDLAGDAYLIRASVSGRAWFCEPGTGNSYFLDGLEIKLFDAPGQLPAELIWRSKLFVLPRPENFGCALVELDASISLEASAARELEIAETIVVRAQLIEDDDVGGEIGGFMLGEVDIAGDALPPVPAPLAAAATISVYADGQIVGTLGPSRHPQRLPGGFKAREWEVVVATNSRVDQITLATTADELKRVPAQ